MEPLDFVKVWEENVEATKTVIGAGSCGEEDGFDGDEEYGEGVEDEV